VPARGAGDEAAARRSGAAPRCVVERRRGGGDAVEAPVVGEARVAERVSAVEVAWSGRERRLEAEQAAELTARLRRLQLPVQSMQRDEMNATRNKNP